MYRSPRSHRWSIGWPLLAAVLATTLATGCGPEGSSPRADSSSSATGSRSHPLLVRDGDKVTGYGTVVADDDGARLCGPPSGNVEGGPFTFPTSGCPVGVPLQGLPPEALAPSGAVLAGNVDFRGVWGDGGVTVQSWDKAGVPVPRASVLMDSGVVPCPEPPGGWPLDRAVPQEDYPKALLELRSERPDDAHAVAVLRPAEDRMALGVVAADEAAAARITDALRADYGKAVCVKVSEYTRDDYRAAARGARYVHAVTDPEFATGLRWVLTWQALVVDREVADALNALPQGLVAATTALIQRVES